MCVFYSKFGINAYDSRLPSTVYILFWTLSGSHLSFWKFHTLWVLPLEALLFILPMSIIYSSFVKVTYHDKKWQSLLKSTFKNMTIFPRYYHTRIIFNLPLTLYCNLNSIQARLGKVLLKAALLTCEFPLPWL